MTTTLFPKMKLSAMVHGLIKFHATWNEVAAWTRPCRQCWRARGRERGWEREKERRDESQFSIFKEFSHCRWVIIFSFYKFLLYLFLCTTKRCETMQNCLAIAMEDREREWERGMGKATWKKNKAHPRSVLRLASWWLWLSRWPGLKKRADKLL